MMLDYINEAFRSLDSLTEDMFKADSEGINELSDFMDADSTEEETISIIDMDAETEDDLQDSYIGKVIVDCNICHSHVFKNKEDIKIDADGVVDIEEECPYCGDNNGFVIIGEIHEFNPNSEESEAEESNEISAEETNEIDNVETDIQEETEEIIEESLTEESNMSKLRAKYPELAESFKNVSLETEDQIMTMTSEDNGKVTVTTEPTTNESAEGEVIAPVTPETEEEIINSNTEVIEEPVEEETPAEEEELEFDFEEVDEDSMSELGESYLKNVYENVDSFKLTSCSTTPNQLIMEGLITFKSGVKKNTGFIFEAKDATKDGKLRFIGENAHLCRGRKAFTLVGSMNEKKLMCESFTYNYRAKNADGKSTRVYGKVNRSK